MKGVVFLLAISFGLILCAFPNPNLKYFGYYTYNDNDYLELTGTANLFYVMNFTAETVIDAHKHGFSVMYLCQQVFFSGSPLTLRSDYLQSWKDTMTIASPLIDSGALFGFMMGDELVFNGLSWDSLNTAINLVKQTYPNSTVYYNEAYPVFTTGSYNFPSVFPMLDWISIDTYPPDGFTFESTYALYVQKLYPLMSGHQKVMYVPPGYSTVLDAMRFCGSPNCENGIVAWNQQTWNWAMTDDHFVGLFPWHWDAFNQPPSGFELGVVQLQYLKQVMFSIGKQTIAQEVIVSDTVSGGICGLGTNQNADTYCGGQNVLESCPSGFDHVVWNVANAGSGSMGFCALQNGTNGMPIGSICGLNLMMGQVVMCGGIDPYLQAPYCPDGYSRQEWITPWGGGFFYYCEKNTAGPDVVGTICGMVNGDNQGVLCNGVNPADGCPTGYAPAAWDIPFGNGLWSVCYKIA